MASNVFGGNTAKNYAIKGHPPLGSFEYVMVRGCPAGYAPPPKPWRSREASLGKDVEELKIPEKKGFYLYEISHSDWDAAQRWMSNLAENVKYTRKVHGEKILTNEEVAKFDDLWRRWLLLGNKIEVEKKVLKDESIASKILAATLPQYWAARKIATTTMGVIALMSTENKRQLDGLLGEAWKLYSRFRRLGMSQVAIPYMGELVVLLRTLPPEGSQTQPKTADMAARLRDAVKVGERLLDENTAWWQWRSRSDTSGLRLAIKDAESAAEDFGELAKIDKHITRSETIKARKILLRILHRSIDDPDMSPSKELRKEFIRVLSRVYIEAAGLYGVEETKKTARADLKDTPVEVASKLGWILAISSIGYLGIRWLTRDKQTIVVESSKVGYHPDVDGQNEHEPESE